jgi:peptidoglycan/LPS O-acetylase OafA/YrhL
VSDRVAPAAAETPQHLAYLDGLRGVAILLVVAYHGSKYTMDIHQGWTYHALAEGAHGVDLFFVISGFCLAYPILRQHVDVGVVKFDVLRFYCRRIIRIVPAYWVAFLALLALALFVVWRGGQLPYPTVALPPTVANGFNQLFFLNTTTNLCGSFWTLAVEFRWYIYFPLAMWLYVRWPWLIYAILAIDLFLYNFTHWILPDFATLPAFLLGVIAADLVIRNNRFNRFALILFGLGVIASLALEPKNHLSFTLQNQFWWQVTAFFFVVAGAASPLLRRLLSHRSIAGIGIAAYSIYLYHDPIEAWYGYSGGRNLLLATVAGVLIGVVAWMFFERHIMERRTRDAIVGALERAFKAVLSWPRKVAVEL